jgi:septum formation topological specificity factor MinE
VRLKDGTVISVQDLKRGFLSQQSFTRGTQENAKERETLASKKGRSGTNARSLQEQRDFILQVAQQYVPQPPDRSLLDRNSPNFDPITYAALKAEYDDRSALNKLHRRPRPNRSGYRKEQERKRKARQRKPEAR